MIEFYAGIFKGIVLCLAVIAGASLLSGCAGQVSEPAIDVAPYCQVAKPIFWSSADTRKTKEQADRENAKYKALCMKPKDVSATATTTTPTE